MKRLLSTLTLALGVAVLRTDGSSLPEPRTAPPAPPVAPAGSVRFDPDDPLYRLWESGIRNRLGLGLRARQVKLKDTRRPEENSFMGTIVQLDLERDRSFVHPYLFYDAMPFLRFEASRETLRTRTWTSDGHTDGAFRFSGPSLVMRLRYPNPLPVIPGIGIGMIWHKVQFAHDPRWANGFGFDETGQRAYEDWVARGSPPYPNNGYQRRLETQPRSEGLVLCATLDAAIGEHWTLGLYIRRVKLSTRGQYTLRTYGVPFDDRGWYEFPHDYTQTGMHVSYRF